MEWVRDASDFIYSLYIRTVLKVSQATRTGRLSGSYDAMQRGLSDEFSK